MRRVQFVMERTVRRPTVMGQSSQNYLSLSRFGLYNAYHIEIKEVAEYLS